MFNSEHFPTRTTRLSSSLSATILSTTTTTRDEHAMEDIALEEKLDELDPLRHLREDDSDQDSSAHLVPAQPPSIRDQTIELTFHASADTTVPAPVTIKLAVDASPGCGGIAWPAGEVRARALHLAICSPRSTRSYRVTLRARAR